MKTPSPQQIKTRDGKSAPTISPSINIHEREEAVLLEAELPGVKKEDIHLEVTDNEVVVTGRRPLEGFPPGFTSLIQERRAVEFRRSFLLSPDVDGNKITAKYSQGVLILTIPKSERTKPQKINIE